MPKRYYKKTNKKRYNKRKYQKRRPYSSRNRPRTLVTPQAVPERLFTKLKYCEQIQWALTNNGQLYAYTFQSSIYDPDLTGVGHQPYWRDQYATLYNKYRVWGVKYHFIFKQHSTEHLTFACFCPQTTSNEDTNSNTIIERPNSRYVNCEFTKAAHLGGYISLPKLFGMSKKEFVADDGFVSAVGSSPSRMGYFVTYMMSRVNTVAAFQQIFFKFYVEYFDRAIVTGS